MFDTAKNVRPASAGYKPQYSPLPSSITVSFHNVQSPSYCIQLHAVSSFWALAVSREKWNHFIMPSTPHKKIRNSTEFPVARHIFVRKWVFHSWKYILHYWASASSMELRCFSLLAMMTSSNGNIFRVTGPLCGEFTGDRGIPRTNANAAELWCFLWSASELTIE